MDKYKSTLIGVFANTSFGFEYLDFSFVNLRTFKIDHEEPNKFKEFIYSISPPTKEHDSRNWSEANYKHYRGLINPKHLRPNLIALVPINLDEPVSELTIEILEAVLLIMFPSDFKLYMLDSYVNDDGEGFLHNSSLDFRFENHHRWDKDQNVVYNPLAVDISKLKEINSFIRNAYDAVEKLRYLRVSVNSYVRSFKHFYMDMPYVNLCMALESIVSPMTEINYRLARSIAVICSTDKETGRAIFSNVKTFYDVRSKIVHGSNYEENIIQKYFFHLQALVSRTLIELISLKDTFTTSKDLTKWIDESGYGDKTHLSNYVYQDFNSNIAGLIKIHIKHLK